MIAAWSTRKMAMRAMERPTSFGVSVSGYVAWPRRRISRSRAAVAQRVEPLYRDGAMA